MNEIIVVLGKTSIHELEVEPLQNIGRAIAKRNKILRTTKSAGVCREVVAGYEKEGGKTQYILKGEDPTLGAAGVLVFSNAKYQQHLTERKPDWQDENWIIFHNRKATIMAETMIRQILTDLGTPLLDRGVVVDVEVVSPDGPLKKTEASP